MKKYIDPILHWWWLIFLCTAVAGVFGYLAVRNQPPVYEVRSTVIVGQSFSNPNPTTTDFYLEQQLASIYATVWSQGSVAESTRKALNLNGLPEYQIRPVASSPVIEIVVSDTDPARAQAVANTMADQLTKTSPSGQTQQNDQRQTFLNEQLDKLQTEIKDTEQQILDAQQTLATVNSARQITDTQNLITALDEKRISLQANYANLLANTAQGAVNNVSVLQYAQLPTTPIGPGKMIYLLMAAAAGFALSVVCAYAIDLIENRAKTAGEISELLKAPILAQIPTINEKENVGLYTLNNPRAPITDEFRSLRTNIEFLGIERPNKVILLTSPSSSEGKSTIAANLALTLAQAGKKIILLDCDLRSPVVADTFKIPEAPGLTEACIGKIPLESAIVRWSKDLGENRNEAAASIPALSGSLWILPAGSIPPNPSEFVSSPAFNDVLNKLRNMADMIIIDSAPLFLPDTSILLPKVDGVVLVFRPGKTARPDIEEISVQIQRSGARLLGIAINRSGSVKTYYGKYKYKAKEKPAGLAGIKHTLQNMIKTLPFPRAR